MWNWYSADEPPPGATSPQKSVGDHSVTDLTEQLIQNEQLVLQLKELIREKDNQLHVKDQFLKEEKEAFEAKISKMKLQNKARVTSLSAQLEDVKKQLGASGAKNQPTGKHKQSSDGDQENAAANRGKILMLRKKVEELESQVAKKDAELNKALTELESQLQRGSNVDMMLAEKEKKLAEKEAYIVELQLTAASDQAPQQVIQPNEEIKTVQDQVAEKETSVGDLQSMVHSLTRKIEESEERFSLLQEQAENLKDQLNKEKSQFQEKEAMYRKNIHVFQEMIQAKENKLAEQAQRHEQELFIVASKSDASADFEQLLKALKQKLHEKEEVLMGRTQVVAVLQKELDGRDQQIQEMIEKLKILQLEKDNLVAKLDAEKHVMRAQVRDLMERHEMDLKNVKEKHNIQLRALEEKHEAELTEKEQRQLKLQKQLQDLQAHGNVSVALEATATVDNVAKQKIKELEEQLKLKTEDAVKSEAKFLKMKAWSKSRIRQAEGDLRNAMTGSSHQEQIVLKHRVAELEEEKGKLEQKTIDLDKLRAQNEVLLAKLELYEEQQQKMQADLEQVTKRAISQTSESGSAEELQSRLLEWQEMVSESARGQAKEERAVMELRMTQIEEEREALVSGQQELEEELVQLRRLGQRQERKKHTGDNRKLEGDYEYDEKQHFESSMSLDRTDNVEGENLGGLWPEYSSHHTGLRAVVEELELERNRLQEQILVLEEHCQDLEDKAQLRTRVEFHQNECERLQNQLSFVRSQQSRDSEHHQHLISSLNEQLKGISNKKDFLENSLVAKEQMLAEVSHKLPEMEKLKESLAVQGIINRDLTEKLLHTEEDLARVTEKRSAVETECADLKNIVLDLTEKLSSNKEKVQKQDMAMETLHQELEQSNDELERLNSSHLEERARLIDDLQSCEREIDTLKETIVAKEYRLTVLSKSVAEYSEQNETLKKQNHCKEQETGELQAALAKVEMEFALLKKTQSVDEQAGNTSISTLVHQLSKVESELSHAQSEGGAKGEEIVALMKQIGENNNTIQSLRSELQKENISNKAQLVECRTQISSLETKVAATTQQLQESNAAGQQEIEKLKVQMIEISSAKGRLVSSLREKEEKEQRLENELKTLETQCSNLIAASVGEEGELAKLTQQFAEHREETGRRLQEKLDIVASLEQRLQSVEQTNSQLVQEVQAKETEKQDLQRQVDEVTRLVTDLHKQTKKLDETNVQLQATVKDQVQSLSEQAKLLSESTGKYAKTVEIKSNLERQVKELSVENENLSEILNNKEDELTKKKDVVQQLENGMASKEEQITQYTSTIFQLQKEKEAFVRKLDLLKAFEQKEVTLGEQLHEKINECHFLKNQILEQQKTAEQIRGQLQSLTLQLEELRLLNTKKEDALSNKSAECGSLQKQLREGQERLLQLQDQVQAFGIELGVKDVTFSKKLSECNDLQKALSQHQLTAKSLESQVQALREEKENLRQRFDQRESLLSSKSIESHDLQGQLDQKADTIVSLQKQMEALNIDKERLQSEIKELQISASQWTAEHDQLQRKANDCESAAALARDQTRILSTENHKFKEEFEEMNSQLHGKTDEIAALRCLLSQKVGMITSFNEGASTLNVATETFTLQLEEKQVSPNQQAVLLQQRQGEGQLSQYMQIISQLQTQVQVMVCEAARLKQTLQEKETTLQQQTAELGELGEKAAEHGALELQSTENMGTILKLENQIQDMTFKTHELKCAVEERDRLLTCKIEECVKVKTAFSETEDSVSQLRVQLAAASSEAEQLKRIIQEKELAVLQIKESTRTCNEALMLQMQAKEIEYATLREKFINLEHAFSQLNSQISQQNSELSQVKEVLVQKEASIVEQRNLVRKWQDNASESDLLKSQFTESTEQISQLQGRVQNMLSDSKRLEGLLQDKETAFSHLQERYALQSEQFRELHVALRAKEEEVAELRKVLCEKDVNIQVRESNANALMVEVEALKEELQKSQVSLADSENVLLQKDELIAINQRNVDSQIAAREAQKNQYKEAVERLKMINQEAKQDELILQKKYLDQTQHVEKLESELKTLSEKSAQDYQEKAALIENLHQQCDQLQNGNSHLDHQINMLKMEKEQVSASYQGQLQQKSGELLLLEEKLATMCDIREKLDVTQQMTKEIDCLQKQVSLKSEEMAKLKSEVPKLEQNLMESERKWLVEFGRETEKNSLLTEKLSNLENQTELKDVKIDSLQKALDNLQAKLCEQSSALQTSANRMKENQMLASKFSQQVVEKQSRLNELSALISSSESTVNELKQILSEKEKEIENLQSRVSVSEKDRSEITESMVDKLMSSEEEKFSLCNEIKQIKLSHHLELEALQRQVADLQARLEQSQTELKERQQVSDESFQQSSSVQEQMGFLKEELNKKSQQLEDAIEGGAQHFDALQKKEQAVHILNMQVNQQQERVISLSQQLRERDVSTEQLTESISKEMVKAAEEERHLTDQIEKLKAQFCVSDEKVDRLTGELEEHKKQLEQQEILQSTKEIHYQDIATKNQQLHSQTQTLTKERDLFKKKLQAALLTRRDLMKKVEELQKVAIADSAKDQQTAELQQNCRILESQTQELSSEVAIGQNQIKQLETHLEILKQQLVEKDTDINILSETLSKKETAVEQLQKNVSQCEMEREARSVELLQTIQEKDSSIAQLQSVLKEKEKTFEDQCCRLNSDLEKIKIALSKKPEPSNAELPETPGEGGFGVIEVIDQLNALKQEKEHLQRKLQAALLARKETIKKGQEKDKHHKEQLSLQREECSHISEMYFVQTKELENVKEELTTLHHSYQTKRAEFECNRELIGTLQKQLHSVNVLLNDKEKVLEQLKVQLEEQESKMFAAFGQQDEVQILEKKLSSTVSTLAIKDADMKGLQGEKEQLQQDKTELMSELGSAQVRIVETSEEAQMLKHSLSRLECRHQEEKESQAAEISWLQNQWHSIQAEVENLKIALEGALKDKENYSLTLENSAEEMATLKTQLLDLHREKDQLEAQLTTLQGENAEIQSLLKQPDLSGKADEEENLCAQQLLSAQSELEMVLESLQERDNSIKSLECALSEKEKLLEELGLRIQKQAISHEMAKERTKTTTIEVQQRAADNPEENKSKELIQRKLQAALISRKEALKENKTLKQDINTLTSEKEELTFKISTLERSLAEMKKQLEPLQRAGSVHHEEERRLLSEVDRIFAEKQNLNVACESLKHTLDSVIQEKQDFSHQLDSLKIFQAAELSEWKAKHDELKNEYESLLQSYENIGNEMDKMRQVVEMTRKEKQEVVFRLHELEAEQQNTEKQLEEASNQNDKMKDKMRKLAKSKQQRVQELEGEIERISSNLQTISAANQSHTNELSIRYSQLLEENKLLTQTYEELKSEFDETQNEREHLLKELNTSTCILDELRAKEAFQQPEIDKFQVNESLSSGTQSLDAKAGEGQVVEQARQLLSEKLHQLKLQHRVESHEKDSAIIELQHEVKAYQQETVNLNEKVKVLEDDKTLLQEELENVQETSENIKNEKENLEAELLKNADTIDQLTEAVKTLHVQNNSLVSELDGFREEKCQLVKEKETQEIKLVKEFEEKLRSARRGKSRSKGETKELQELLKEKQQEINQLQKDCIKYQELILDLERAVKTSESAREEMRNKLESATKKASCSEEQVRRVQEELVSCKVLLRNTRNEAGGVHAQCLGLMEELQKKEEKTKAQITEKEKELLLILDQQKTIHQKEIVSYQDKLDFLEHDKDRVVAELLEVQAELNGRDLLMKKLQGELNNNLANLAAFTKCMSSLQDDRDRIIEESKTWETRFQDTIQNKENQVQAKEEMLQKLHEEIKQKSFNLQALQYRSLKLEQTIDELTVSSKDAEGKHQNEMVTMKETICQHTEKIEELEGLLKEKEAALSKLSQESNYLSTQLSDLSHSVTTLKMTEQVLEKDLTEKQSETHQLQAENAKLNADLQKQNAISQQLKLMLSNKDVEISKLVSSKDGEISEYVADLQEQYRKQMEDCETQLKIFQHDSQKAASEAKELQVQIDKSREEKDQVVAKMDVFTKSMASLQDDRDRILSEYSQLELRHLDMLSQKDGIIQESATQNNKLQQEIKNLLNQMDDLNSENAMLKAQLIKHREELNQILSLKDTQLKELLQKQLQQIKNLENEKSNLEEQWKEAQNSFEKCNESIKSLRAENERILEQVTELRAATSPTQKNKLEANETKLFLELQRKLEFKTLECDELKKEIHVQRTKLEESENKLGEVEGLAESKTRVKISDKAAEMVRGRTEEKLIGLSKDLVSEQRRLDIVNENKELAAPAESFQKAVTVPSSDRGRLLEDIQQLQIKQSDEPKLKEAVCVKDQNLWNDPSEMTRLRNKVEELEKLLWQAKLQEHAELDHSSCLNELAELRSVKNILLSESRTIKERCRLTVADRDRQVEELRKLNQEVWSSELGNVNSLHQIKPLEIVSLLGSETVAEQVRSLLMEKKQLQSETQSYLQEIHRKEQRCQQLNSKVTQCIDEKATLSSQLKAISQTLRDTQSLYGDLQDRYCRLERQYQAVHSSLQNEEQSEANEEVPPGAPQERASVIVEIDNLELIELRRRLAESDQRNDSAHQELSQLAEILTHEELRRSAAEEALMAAEEMLKRLDMPTASQPAREYTIQLESDEEREALIIDPSEHVVVRKVKRGALSFKRWLRGRSLYCSKLMSSRTRSRYLVFAYFVTLHILVFMCLTGLL
ncbi:uncharacterized protein [Scyliorhinus torazame]|uniref:uncharacterized protein isoform X1 n=1 Tax=Scyliorhinus torazame TaxID=75743 RepID=UPI003B59B545